jgi:hypothetical protein
VSLVINAAIAVAQAAIDAAEGALGIQSPSKVFEVRVGWQMAAGMAQGWERGIQALMPGTMGGLMPATAGIESGRTSYQANGGRGFIFNNYGRVDLHVDGEGNVDVNALMKKFRGSRI